MASVEVGWIAGSALLLSAGALVAAVTYLVKDLRRERAYVVERLDQVIAAIGALSGAMEQTRSEAAVARTAVQRMQAHVAEIHHETCGPVTLRPVSLRPSDPGQTGAPVLPQRPR